MNYSDKHIRQYALFYLLCFLLNYAWFYVNGLTFSSLDPVFFTNRLDITRNVLMLTGIQHRLLSSETLRMTFDLGYLFSPLVLVFVIFKEGPGRTLVALAASAIALVYGVFFSSMSYISTEGYMSWILMPMVFASRRIKTSYLLLHCIRLIFILMMASTAWWKIRTGSLYNPDQMAGILLHQHSAYLVTGKQDWFTNLVYYLVQHRSLAFGIYLLAVLIEALFAIGLFTRKFDKQLLFLFCLFLVFDFFIMRINYSGWIVFTGCFYFSRFSMPDNE